MKYNRTCWWCKKEFETDDIDQDYCSIECFHKDEEDHMKQMDEEA